MAQINKLTSTGAVTSSDAVPVWSQENGDTRQAPMSVILAYMQDNLTAISGQTVTQYASPLTGETVSISSPGNIWLVLTPAAAIAALAIDLPNDPINRQELNVSTSQAVGSLTINGAAVIGAPVALAPETPFRLRYDGISGAWYLVEGASGSSAPTAPAFTANPAITGTAEIGQTLTVSNGTTTGTTPITYSYAWQRDGSPIAGATAQTYVLVAADDGATVSCIVTAANGTSPSATATATGVAVTYAAPTASGSLADVTITEGAGDATRDAGALVTGAGGTWAVTVNGAVNAAVATIDGAGVVTVLDNTVISAATISATYTNSGGSVSRAFSATVSESFTTLAYPSGVTFPGVTLQRSATQYRVLETAADFDSYAGTTIYVTTSGDDSTGTGAIGAPFRQINAAIAAATAGDIINVGAGEFTSFTVTKDVKITGVSGETLIGVFDDLAGATWVDQTFSRENISPASGGLAAGFIILSEMVNGSRFGMQWRLATYPSTAAEIIVANQALDIPFINVSGSTSSVWLPGGRKLQTLLANGDAVAWRTTSTTGVVVQSDCFLENLIIANDATDAVFCSTTNVTAAMNACEVYGGVDSGVKFDGTNCMLVMFDCIVAGANQDNVDSDSTAKIVMVGGATLWAGAAANNNCFTPHADSLMLGVGVTMAGGCRTVHTVSEGWTGVFSCTLGPALYGNDVDVLGDRRFILGAGNTAPLSVPLDYGNVTFDPVGSEAQVYEWVAGTQTITEINPGDAWPY